MFIAISKAVKNNIQIQKHLQVHDNIDGNMNVSNLLGCTVNDWWAYKTQDSNADPNNQV